MFYAVCTQALILNLVVKRSVCRESTLKVLNIFAKARLLDLKKTVPGTVLGEPENDDFPRSHVVPGTVLGTPENDDFPRSHVVPWTVLEDTENDDFPRSHVVPGTVLGDTKTTIFRGATSCLGRFWGGFGNP